MHATALFFFSARALPPFVAALHNHRRSVFFLDLSLYSPFLYALTRTRRCRQAFLLDRSSLEDQGFDVCASHCACLFFTSFSCSTLVEVRAWLIVMVLCLRIVHALVGFFRRRAALLGRTIGSPSAWLRVFRFSAGVPGTRTGEGTLRVRRQLQVASPVLKGIYRQLLKSLLSQRSRCVSCV